ncbi:uncharacterized protein L3040_005764 [Drepanopeziza brunnea f. sp. 'multigermtubi']|uniref:uncharacterized protein n=2 Tax=Drepanopeziza brunnea f. sp. 'multigermtubi' TaxID=698441 RepID=UPI00238816DF|nr:hypothetical protein L3040_005764 [Drepanopeziza brunnea f. sp. 'multigermtubi']
MSNPTVEETIARLTSGSKNEGVSLASQIKQLYTKSGGKIYTKPCGGPRFCKSLICDHNLAKPDLDAKVKDAPSAPDPKINPEHIKLIMARLEKDGYPVTEEYLTEAYCFYEYKIAATIITTKSRIDAREEYLHETGRINMHRERRDAIHSAPTTKSMTRYGNGLPIARNKFLDWLVEEDDLLENAAAPHPPGYVPLYKRLAIRKYSKEEEDAITRCYLAEAKYREERSEYFKACKSEGLAGDELEKVMETWEMDAAVPFNVDIPNRRGVPRLDAEGNAHKAVLYRTFHRMVPGIYNGACGDCSKHLAPEDEESVKSNAALVADRETKAAEVRTSSKGKGKEVGRADEQTEPTSPLEYDCAAIRARRKAYERSHPHINAALDMERATYLATNVYTYDPELKRTTSTSPVGEPAEMVKIINKLADLDLKYEIIDNGEGRLVLNSERILGLIDDLNTAIDSLECKIVDEDVSSHAVATWKNSAGHALVKLFKYAIVTNHLIMEEELHTMVQWTLSRADELDREIKARSYPRMTAAERDHKFSNVDFQSDMKEFMLLAQKTVALPDASDRGLAQARLAMKHKEEKNMEDFMMHRLRTLTGCFHLPDVLNVENIPICEELMEKARDFDFVVDPPALPGEGPADTFRKALAIFQSGDEQAKGPEEHECVARVLQRERVPTKIALLCLLGEPAKGQPDQDSEMRQIVRASLRADLVTLLAYYDQNRDTILGGGTRFLRAVTGINFADMSAGTAARQIRRIDARQVWRWLIDYQVGRARLDTDVKGALGEEVMAFPPTF